MSWPFSLTPIQIATVVPVTVVAIDIIRRLLRDQIERKGYPLPPGPSALPLLGSALSLNTEEPWLTYMEWQKKYGDLIYARLLDSDVVILNTVSDATALLEKRSQTYSDRPSIATIEPYGHSCNFGFARYGEHWRLCRRIFHQTFRADSALNFRPMQMRRARQIIVNMIDGPDDYYSHYSTFSAAVAMSAVYDYEPTPRNDPMVSIINHFLSLSIPALTPEKALLIKAFPFLLRMPDWLPGSSIKREANDAYEWSIKALETPYQHAEKRVNTQENINPTMVADHIARMKKLDDTSRSEYETALKHTASTAFMGAAETTASSLMTFTLAMVENPRIWKRAQAEIDSVVGMNRLPEFDDRPSLPYVEAILREALRWQPAAPLGVPHATTSSDIYKGFFIPKGAIVIYNVWAMSRDETRYPDPEKFIPERFLDREGVLTDDNPAEFAFGFGRRVCPGRHTADASVWSGIVTMLATLDFNPAVDTEGKVIKVETKYSKGVARHPLPFPCQLTPRPHITKPIIERVLAQ